MRRRPILAGATALLSTTTGCLADKRTTAMTTQERRRVSIEAIENFPNSVPADFAVTMTEEGITEQETARLEVSITNTGDRDEQFGPPYYKGASSDAGEPGILLYSVNAGDIQVESYTPDCWDTEQPSQDEPLAWSTEGVPVHDLAPGESTTEELLVADDPTVNGCFPRGEYTFETTHIVQDVESTCGFTLTVTDTENEE